MIDVDSLEYVAGMGKAFRCNLNIGRQTCTSTRHLVIHASLANF